MLTDPPDLTDKEMKDTMHRSWDNQEQRTMIRTANTYYLINQVNIFLDTHLKIEAMTLIIPGFTPVALHELCKWSVAFARRVQLQQRAGTRAGARAGSRAGARAGGRAADGCFCIENL